MKSGPRVLVFPAWRDNPFLNLLALSPRAAGWQVLETTTFPGLLAQAQRLVDGDVLHLHWTGPIVQTSSSRAEAAGRLTATRRLLDDLRRRGVRVVWTLHNRLPHELEFPDAEAALYRLLADRVDIVHVMSESTPDVIADICTLDPDRVRVIPHPSYDGVYASAVTRTQARRSFGLDEQSVAVLFLGQLRPYKGIDTLLDAVRAVPVRRDGRPLALLLAGSATPEAQAEIMRRLPPDVHSVVEFGFVPDGDVARWYAAADVTVLPYRAILNSGSAHLAASFRVPVLLPGEAHLHAQFGAQPWVHLYDMSRSDAAIAEALADPDTFAGVGEADFDAFTAPISPWRTSRRYLDLLQELSAHRDPSQAA